MPQYAKTILEFLNISRDTVKDAKNTASSDGISSSKPAKYENIILWPVVVIYVGIHFAALYGIYLGFTSAKVATVLLGVLTYNLAMLGTTAGAHRLWSHRSYKATWQFRLLLTFCHTLTFQHSLIHWARDHRTHHAYSETDGDPHNAKRGFFFSHIGWLLCKKHNDVKEKGKNIDVSDLYEDAFLRIQDQYYLILMPLVGFILPAIVPMYLWNETFANGYFVNIARYVFELHAVGLVNSAAHLWGNKPYDKFINPSENRFASIFTIGEGYHNYHHTFPWDYNASEFGSLNFTSKFIEFFSLIGWAYDLRTTSNNMIKTRVGRTGDGSHELYSLSEKKNDESPKNVKEDVIYKLIKNK